MNSFFGKLLCLILLILKYRYICATDPTDGFTLVPLTEENFKLQKPYNEPLDDRYSDKDGVRSFWIYNHDKPFKTDSTTRPRSEARITVLSLSTSPSPQTPSYGNNKLSHSGFLAGS